MRDKVHITNSWQFRIPSHARTRSIFRIPPHAQDQEHQNGTYAAGLPGICNVNLVSHTMGDGTSSVASSRGVSAFPPHARPHGAQLKIPQLCTPKLGVTAVADCLSCLFCLCGPSDVIETLVGRRAEGRTLHTYHRQDQSST